MLNVFKVKKMAALVMMGLIPSITFFIMLRYNFLYGIIGLLSSVMVMFFVSSLMLRNPFTAMIEGKGILALNLDSTGVIRPFIVSLSAPYIKGRLNGKDLNDVWDREATFSIAAPIKAGKATNKSLETLTPDKQVKKTEVFEITLNEEEYNKGRFALYHYPCIIWNEQTNSILTKDFFAEKEKNSFAEHGVLYLNRKMEELTSAMLNFGRYVIEQLKPKTEWYKNKWVIGVIIFFIIILIGLFIGPVISTVKGSAGAAGGALGGLGNLGGAINPN